MTWQQGILVLSMLLVGAGIVVWLVLLTNRILYVNKALNRTLDKMVEMTRIMNVLVSRPTKDIPKDGIGECEEGE